MSSKTKQEMKAMKKQKKNQKLKKVQVQLAILGGGDVVFPLITAGVVMKFIGFVPALIISVCATISLGILFAFSEKGKSYPAMPFLTIGCLFGLLVVQVLRFFGVF